MVRWWFLAGLVACGPDSDDNRPPCADTLDDEVLHTNRVDRYLYNDVPVYLFFSGNNDGLDTVVRQEDCTVLCAPSGGIDGRGDGGCEDFYDRALLRSTEWEAHPDNDGRGDDDDGDDDRDRDYDG